jgi:hypothetical protein
MVKFAAREALLHIMANHQGFALERRCARAAAAGTGWPISSWVPPLGRPRHGRGLPQAQSRSQDPSKT